MLSHNDVFSLTRLKKSSIKKDFLLKEHTKTKKSYYAQNLLEIADNLKHEKRWEQGEINSMILKKNEHRKEVLIVMHSDTKIESVQRDQSITISVIEGEIKFKTSRHLIHLSTGQFFTLSEKLKYSFTSLEESTLLITVYNIKIPN